MDEVRKQMGEVRDQVEVNIQWKGKIISQNEPKPEEEKKKPTVPFV